VVFLVSVVVAKVSVMMVVAKVQHQHSQRRCSGDTHCRNAFPASDPTA
jgi:hypothetical protein